MADLNVAIILRLLDQTAGPARAAMSGLMGVAAANREVAGSAGVMGGATEKASAATTGLAAVAGVASTASGALAAAAEKASLAQTAQAGSAAVVTEATNAWVAASEAAAVGVTNLGSAAERAGVGTGGLAREAGSAAEAMEVLSRATEGAAAGEAAAGREAERTAERMTLMQRGQRLAAAGAAGLKVHADALATSLGKIALADIALQGLDRAGRAINDPLHASVERQAEYAKNITGIGIIADIPKDQLAVVSKNIIEQAQRLALPINTVVQDDMAVLNEGVYRGVAQLKAASRSAASLSLLAESSGSPLGGPEAGAVISTYAHSLSVPAEQLDRYNAELFRASQLGGDKIGDVARFLPAVTAQLKGRAFGNEKGFVDALAAFQVVKRVSGDDESAGIDLKDFLAGINNAHTKKRFAKEGIDIDAAIVSGERAGVSPIKSIVEAIRGKIGNDPNDPTLVSKLGKFFVNQQAAQAALALLQYQDDGAQGIGFNNLVRQISAPEAQTRYAGAVAAASTGSFADLQRATNAKDAAAIATGGAMAPVTRAASAAQRGLFGGVQGLMEGPAGQAVAVGAAGVGAAASAAAGAGNAVVGVLAPMIIMKSLTGELLPDLAKLVGGRALGALGGVAEAAGAGMAFATGPALAFAAALLANPITWIVAAVLALGAAAFVIVRNWGPISAFFAGVWARIGAPVARALGFVTRLLMDWTPLGFFVRLAGVLTQGVAQLAAPLGRMAGVVGGALARVGMAILAFTPVPMLFHAFQAVWPWLEAQVPRFVTAGGHLIAGLARGLLAGVFAVHDALRHVGDDMINGLKVRLGIRSPSLVFHGLGLDTMAGLTRGLQAGSADPVSHVGRVAARITAALAVGGASIALPAAAETLAPRPGPAPVAARAAAANGRTVHLKLEQHFHLDGRTDIRALARELQAHGAKGLRAALHDIEDGA